MKSQKTANQLNTKNNIRLKVINEVIASNKTQENAGFELGICARQVRLIVKKVRVSGDDGVLHGGIGRICQTKLDNILINNAENLLRDKYHDFGSTLAAEKLTEIYGIKTSKETIRQLQIKNKLA